MRILPAILLLFTAASALAANAPPLAALSDAEQSYYRQVFDYTMDNIKPDGHFDWETYDAKGSIAATKSFVSKSGYTCRNFSESYAIAGQAGSDKGTSCKRIGKDGWCRLKPDNALTCALEDPYYHIGMPGVGSAPDMPNVNIDAPGNTGNTNTGYNVNAPHTSGSGNKPTAGDAANTITGTAGNAAGYVAKNAGGWFSSLFR